MPDPSDLPDSLLKTTFQLTQGVEKSRLSKNGTITERSRPFGLVLFLVLIDLTLLAAVGFALYFVVQLIGAIAALK